MKPIKFNASSNLSSSLLFHKNRTFPVRPVTQPIQKIGPQFPNVCLLSSDEQWEIDELVISVVHNTQKLSKLNATALEAKLTKNGHTYNNICFVKIKSI